MHPPGARHEGQIEPVHALSEGARHHLPERIGSSQGAAGHGLGACGARAGLWTRKRKLHCPEQAEQRCHRDGGEHQVLQNAIGGGIPQNANTVLAGPTSGGPAAASFRALVGADLPVPFTVPGPVTVNTSNQPQPNPIYVPFRCATIANGDPVCGTAPARRPLAPSRWERRSDRPIACRFGSGSLLRQRKHRRSRPDQLLCADAGFSAGRSRHSEVGGDDCRSHFGRRLLHPERHDGEAGYRRADRLREQYQIDHGDHQRRCRPERPRQSPRPTP